MDCSMTAAWLSITNSWSSRKLMSTESVMPSNRLILCLPLLPCLQSFPASGSFPMSQFFASSGQSVGVSVSASVLPTNFQDWFPFTCSPRAMASHSSTLVWRIPWMEDPGRLQSMESRRVGHDWANSLSLFTFMHWRRKWQPTPVFLPRESPGQGSMVGCHLWGCTESDTTEATQQQQQQQSKGLSRVCSNTTIQKHQFFGAQLSLYSNSDIHTWLREKNIALTRWTFVCKVMSVLFYLL